jgi:hypothetical protein
MATPPPSTGWFLIDGTGHLFLDPKPRRPVCGADPDRWGPLPRNHDQWCAECERYLFETYGPHMG